MMLGLQRLEEKNKVGRGGRGGGGGEKKNHSPPRFELVVAGMRVRSANHQTTTLL